MDYKLVVLPDGREIEVPDDHRWMAMDEAGEWSSGAWYSYQEKPIPEYDCTFGGYWRSADEIDCQNVDLYGPFESGDWTTQLYWIGD